MRYISCLPDEGWQSACPRSLAILGSTGSIGRYALDVIRRQGERFRVAALAGARNIPLLAQQAAEFRPDAIGLLDASQAPQLRKLLPSGYSPDIMAGQQGYEAIASLAGISTVLSAQVGAAGLRATVAAAMAGKVIALANKESLVLAGGLIRACCAASGASILPVDSEHNAIFQCLAPGMIKNAPTQSRRQENAAEGTQGTGFCLPPDAGISRLILTASGGPFYGWSRAELAKVTASQALRHPNWSMGAKISIDSATLMNKGLELIEAHHFYGLPMACLDVVVHRESIIHSLVAFTDGSYLAQLSLPDMRIPIAYCLGWPERINSGASTLDLAALSSLSFTCPDEASFPCLALARQAQERGSGSPVVLNAANEEAVVAFLDKRIGFPAIAELVGRALADYASGIYSDYDSSREPESVEEILSLDAEARIRMKEVIRGT
jgi:1-deoxy-D-xylulose-5-phosphate reductoisomerase